MYSLKLCLEKPSSNAMMKCCPGKIGEQILKRCLESNQRGQVYNNMEHGIRLLISHPLKILHLTYLKVLLY